ncbi:ArsR/SmtB family transcription factor [Fodinicurvata fenggangensis]|uniref:ArsR/SmtB family transcription factor n=1 Tax=Fodinicurvata fenggangensis TaxID=1121830 RepID=UPI0005528408|nr:metalloregulator ArsR/SmtB family transcription factor [Fodinicurvata fenggangensis]
MGKLMRETFDRQELEARAQEVSQLLKSLANPNRLMIVCTLLEGERSVAELENELGIHQPTLSQQLTALREAGLVQTRRESRHIYYRLKDDKTAQVIEALYRIFCSDQTAEVS